jgi:hypothetical protein
MSPNQVIADLLATAQASFDRYTALYSAVEMTGNDPALRKGLTVDLTFDFATERELFQHRWHLAAVSKRPSVFISWAQTSIDDGLKKTQVGHLTEDGAIRARRGSHD